MLGKKNSRPDDAHNRSCALYSMPHAIRPWVGRFRAILRIVIHTLSPRHIAKGLRFVLRGEPLFALRAARNLFLQRFVLADEIAPLRASAELFEALPADPNVPLVSVVIPCVNHGAFVAEAVASALAQTFPSIEVILVDGGSDDRITPAVVEALAGPRVRVLLRDAPPKGLGDNRNFGINEARGR